MSPVGTASHDLPLQRARREAGLRSVRIHDLRHTFACRLRAAGVTAEDREVLLGHANHSIAGHYASADVGHLLKQANRLLDRSGTRTVLRVGSGRAGPGTEVQQSPTAKEEDLVLHAKPLNCLVAARSCG